MRFEVKDMFKRNLLTVMVAAAAVGFGGFAINASASDGTGNARAEIVAPIAVVENLSMNFGSVSGDSDPANNSTVVLTTAGAVTASANAAVIPSSGARAALFDVTGAAGALYDITLPPDPAGVVITSGGNSMTVDNFVDSLGGSGTLSDPGGAESFNVGARLNINGNQAVGVYLGTYTVTVTYQ